MLPRLRRFAKALARDPADADEEERAALWPLGRFPVLVDDGRTVAESSIIIEHLDLHHAGPVRLLPDDRDAALEVRFMDRFFDNYVMTAMQKPVFEALRAEGARKEEAMAEARQALDTAYAWLEEQAGRPNLGGGRELHDGRLRRSPIALLCRLGSPDRPRLPTAAGLSFAPVGEAVLRARRR